MTTTTNDTDNTDEQTDTPFTASERFGKFGVDIAHESGPSLLIQAVKGGYKLDTWWDDNEKQACTHVKYTRTEGDYAYDNTHQRNIEIDVKQSKVVITDTEPRGKEVGHEPASIVVMFDSDEGFRVTVNWINENKEKRQSYAVCPIYDPRFDDQRDRYYELLAEEEANIEPIPAFPQD